MISILPDKLIYWNVQPFEKIDITRYDLIIGKDLQKVIVKMFLNFYPYFIWNEVQGPIPDMG